MRRYQLSGLEHIHMMRHVPRSYDMTRTHILHRGVNKHVDVVLRCSPKNRKKKKVVVSVVKGDKKNEIARIRANAQKGYVAVRKRPVNEKFEEDRKTAASVYAYEKKYGTKSPHSSALIHDMRSQLSTMAKKSADYIDDQLTSKPAGPVISYSEPAVTEKQPDENKPLISEESEEILKKGGYRLPVSNPSGNPYASNYSMHASNEEFHNLMDSLERSLDEACKKYAVQPVTSSADEEPAKDDSQENKDINYSDYSGSYNTPNNISLSVTHKQEITADTEREDNQPEKHEEEFKPALTFTEGGGHYNQEDDLFDRELGHPEERYVPPAYLFDDDDKTPAEDTDQGYVPVPDPVPVQVRRAPSPQEIFPKAEDEHPSAQPEQASEDYPHEDYVQQKIFFPNDGDEGSVGQQLYEQASDDVDFADPTLYSEQSQPEEDSGFDPPLVFPDRDDENPVDDSDSDDNGIILPPMFFTDEDEDEDEGYSPAPVSPDRNEYFDGSQGVINRSEETLLSRTGDRVRKVIGIIRGEPRLKKDASLPNRDVEITYKDQRK